MSSLCTRVHKTESCYVALYGLELLTQVILLIQPPKELGLQVQNTTTCYKKFITVFVYGE